MRIQLASTVSPKIKFDGELRISARVSIISNIIEKTEKFAQLTLPSPTLSGIAALIKRRIQTYLNFGYLTTLIKIIQHSQVYLCLTNIVF